MGLENPLHIAIILVVILMVFGAKKLPEMGKGLGEGMRGFKSAISGESHPEPEARVQQLTAAEEQPATTSSDTEQRTPEPVA
jgi:sec-independent protein translocase protein TatA